MAKEAHRRVALAAAQFLADGTESEYLHAKQRALLALGLSDQTRLPPNRVIKDLITQLAKTELGESEVHRRLHEMRAIALELMTLFDEHDPFLIGSALSGQIRSGSDIDLHAYSDDFNEIKGKLLSYGYEEVEEELVENLKGKFVHLKWHEQGYPVEITVYPWVWRDLVLYSSVTGRPMKRADAKALRKLIASSR